VDERIILRAMDERKVLRRLLVTNMNGQQRSYTAMKCSKVNIHPLSLGHFGGFAIAMNQMGNGQCGLVNLARRQSRNFLGSACTVQFLIVLYRFVRTAFKIQCENIFLHGYLKNLPLHYDVLFSPKPGHATFHNKYLFFHLSDLRIS
jgi:hypothetical protein